MEEQRFPISVRIIGVMHKEKKKMYMTSVLWSDQNEIAVYRTLQEYKEMHKSLKKVFPSGSKLKKSDRAVPKFPARKMKQGRQRKGPAKSLVRLKFLQKYCTELLNCDPRVTQSTHLIQFFHPKDQDLLPEFSKNSIIIMPTEGDGAGEVGNGGNVTQPFVTETYRCMAPYETKDTKNKAFKVALDETVDVLIKDKGGWWLVENEEKRMAWFPAPYLERLDGDEDDVDGVAEAGVMYTVIRNYKATKDDEITVSMGAVVEVLQRPENGWWFIRYNGKAGYIPTMNLQPYNHPAIRLTPHHPESRSSTPLLPASSLSPGSLQLSRSQGNLLQLPAASPSPARQPQPNGMHKSRSLNVLNEERPPAKHSPPPTITVETDDGDEVQFSRSPSEDSDFAFTSDSDFSLSDDLSSSTASSTINLSQSASGLRFARTPEPTTSTHLSPTSAGGGRLIPSVSDPNLYKTPTTPKVPPRPRTQEILTRCTTITRKNAGRRLSPSPTGILVG